MAYEYDFETGTRTEAPSPYASTYEYDFETGKKTEIAGKGDDRPFFDKLTDFMVDTRNVIANLTKAGVETFAPGSEATKNIGQFIEEGRASQSPYRKYLYENAQRLQEEAKRDGNSESMAWVNAMWEAPLTQLGPEIQGNIMGFMLPGTAAAKGATLAARAGGATEAAAALSGSRAALNTTSGLGALVGAGSVRGDRYENVMGATESQLLESPGYVALRQQGLSHADAQKQLAQELDVQTGLSAAGSAGLGFLGGRLGAESRIFKPGAGGGVLRTAAVEGGTEALEEAGQQGFGNLATQAVLPDTSLTQGLGLAATQGAVIGAGTGALAGAAFRPEQPTPADILTQIDSAPTVDAAIMTAGRLVDESLMTAADQPSDLNRMTDDALQKARTFTEGEVRTAEQAIAAGQQEMLGTLREARDDAAFAPLQTAEQEQAVRDADAPAILEAVRQQEVEQAIASVQAEEPNAMQLALIQAREKANVPITNTGQLTDVPAPAGADSRAPTAPMVAPEVSRPGVGQTQSALPDGTPAAVSRSVQPEAVQQEAGVQPTGVTDPVADIPRETWQQVGADSPVSRRFVASLAPGTPVRGPEGNGVTIKADGPLAPGRAKVQWDSGKTTIQSLNGLEVQKTPSRVDALQSAERDSEIEEVSTFPTLRAPGKRLITQKEAGLVTQLAETFGKKVVFFKQKGGQHFNGAVLPDDDTTIYVNTEATDAHHLVVAGHEVAHLMRRDAPDLYDGLQKRLAASLTEGNLANFSRYYNPGETEAQTYARLRDAKQLDRMTEEFVADLIGNRAGEYKTWQTVFASAKGQNDPNLIQRVGKFLIDFIDALLARTNFQKFATDKMVKDLSKARADIRNTLKEYARRQNDQKADLQKAVDKVKTGSVIRPNPNRGVPDGLQERQGQEGAVSKSTGRDQTAVTPSTSVDERLTDLASDKRITPVKVTVRAIVAETGREVTYEESAAAALADVQQRLTLARQLQTCLSS